MSEKSPWIKILSISWASTKLRNFFVMNNLQYKNPTKNGKRLAIPGCAIVKHESTGEIRLASNGSFVSLPSYARYYANVITTEAEMIRSKKTDASAAHVATINYRKNRSCGSRRIY